MDSNKRLHGDSASIVFLLFLYMMQTIPVGLAGSMTLLLQSRNVSYQSQALFSSVFWPFSFKIVWAPIVDAVYSPKLGRRKSWLVPVQYAIGTFMLVLSFYISDLMGSNVGRQVGKGSRTIVVVRHHGILHHHDIQSVAKLQVDIGRDSLVTDDVILPGSITRNTEVSVNRQRLDSYSENGILVRKIRSSAERRNLDYSLTDSDLKRRLENVNGIRRNGVDLKRIVDSTVEHEDGIIQERRRKSISSKNSVGKSDRHYKIDGLSPSSKNVTSHETLTSHDRKIGNSSFSIGKDDRLATGVATVDSAHVLLLTLAFFCMNFLAATQDVCVDGWALTMLSRRNIGWASTCNAVGAAIGYSLGNPVFLALESADLCNKYWRSAPSTQGLVTISGFIYFWGLAFIASTTLILLLATEKPEPDHCHRGKEYSVRKNVARTYRQLYSVLNLRPVRELALVYLTAKVGFSAMDTVTGLKLVEHGLPKEKLALLSVPMIPVQILLPLYLSRHTTGPRPMDLYLKAFPCRLLLNFVFIVVVWWTSYLWSPGGDYPNYYYAVVIFVYALQQVGLYSMAVARTSLNANISDPTIGGSYMSLLTTFSNLGFHWPATLSLYFVDTFTFRNCDTSSSRPCRSKECAPSCRTLLDGYHVECFFAFFIGLLWLRIMSRKIRTLQSLPLDVWTSAINR